MAMVKVATITETTFHVHLTGSVPPSMARAMGSWCMQHGIDPALVPETSPIVRDPVGCRIVYHEIQETPRGVAALIPGIDPVIAAPVTMQGATPPAPFPAEVLAWAARIK
jgi:hypothetical protein